MKALIQRVSRARVTVDGESVGEIGQGYLVLLGVKKDDAEADADYLADRTAALRIFPDAKGLMNLSIIEVGGSVLVVSQFTLHADTRKGNRPSFILAANPDLANKLYEYYLSRMRSILGADYVAAGRFQAMMQVELVNDGPVTIELKSKREHIPDGIRHL